MFATELEREAALLAELVESTKHYGPGPHPDGSPQKVHGQRGGQAAWRKRHGVDANGKPLPGARPVIEGGASRASVEYSEDQAYYAANRMGRGQPAIGRSTTPSPLATEFEALAAKFKRFNGTMWRDRSGRFWVTAPSMGDIGKCEAALSSIGYKLVEGEGNHPSGPRRGGYRWKMRRETDGALAVFSFSRGLPGQSSSSNSLSINLSVPAIGKP